MMRNWVEFLRWGASVSRGTNRSRRTRLSVEPLERRCVLACLVPANTCFAVIGDYGVDNAPEQEVATLVKNWTPDFVITTGDNNYPDGETSTIDVNIGKYHHEFISPYKGSFGDGSASNRFFPSLGNHDWHAPGAEPYLDYFTLPGLPGNSSGNERYYNFTQGPIEFFVVDSDLSEPDGATSTSTQGAWLQGALAASTATWKLVVFHHPPFSSGPHGSLARMQWPFQQWGATAVLNGHDHDYERVVLNGFPYFVNGAGGNSLYAFGTPVPGSEVRYNADRGAMLVDASDTQITFQFIARTGQLIDTYTISLSGPLPTVTIAATDASASEPGTNTGRFTVSRTGSTSDSLRVTYTVSGTATLGSDYNTLDGDVTIPAGGASATITVRPADDTLVEGTETAIVSLTSNASYALGATTSATVNIADNDVPVTLPTVTIAATDASASEPGTNSGRLTVSRTGSTSASLRVIYTVSGTAALGSDYNTLDGDVTIPAGAGSTTITVTPADDTLVEVTETVIVTLSNSASYVLGTTTSATVNIADNDVPVTLPTVTIAATDANSAEPGTNTARFTVSRTDSASAPLTVSYTVSGTATPGSDYAALSGTVTIPSGAASALIMVTPSDDALGESNETVVVKLSNKPTYHLGATSSASAMLLDDEYSPITNFVPSGVTWKYLDNGSDPGTSWREIGFDDSTWRAGPSQLGYGDGDEATVVSFGPDATKKYITTYFRRTFSVSDPSVYPGLTVQLLRDDGAVVYLNGTEVFRGNMPAGTISSTTRAKTAVSGAAETKFFEQIVNPALLQAGTNVVAVEVHQYSAGNADLSFDLQLIGSKRTLVPANAKWKYLDDGSDQGTAWRGINSVDSAWLAGAAQLGYGDGDEATVVSFGPDALNKYTTTYFRHTFAIADPLIYQGLTLRLLRDDGAVVYLNNTEVFRSNMPTGSISYVTPASSDVEGTGESTFLQTVVDASLLRSGANVLAVEVHQATPSSSDISFAMELIGSTA